MSLFSEVAKTSERSHEIRREIEFRVPFSLSLLVESRRCALKPVIVQTTSLEVSVPAKVRVCKFASPIKEDDIVCHLYAAKVDGKGIFWCLPNHQEQYFDNFVAGWDESSDDVSQLSHSVKISVEPRRRGSVFVVWDSSKVNQIGHGLVAAKVNLLPSPVLSWLATAWNYCVFVKCVFLWWIICGCWRLVLQIDFIRNIRSIVVGSEDAGWVRGKLCYDLSPMKSCLRDGVLQTNWLFSNRFYYVNILSILLHDFGIYN